MSPAANVTYTVTASGSGGQSATASVAVTVTTNTAPTVQISANPTSITAGSSLYSYRVGQ